MPAYIYIPSYICAYWGNPASFNHLHASTASISTKQETYTSDKSEDKQSFKSLFVSLVNINQ